MPGRELIKNYLKERSISIADLAKAYGLARQDVTDYLSGRNTSPKSNQFVLKVIKLVFIRIIDLPHLQTIEVGNNVFKSVDKALIRSRE